MTFRRLVATGTVIGIVGGLVEVALILWTKTRTPILEVSRDFIWMVPLAGGIVGTAAAAVAAGAARLLHLPAGRTEDAGLFAPLLLMSFNAALYLPPMHDVAVLILAAGVASVLTRLLRTRFPRGARRPVFLLSIGVVLAALVVGRAGRGLSSHRSLAALPEANDSDPDIVLITIDAGRAFDMSVYGYDRVTTPWLDSLASESVVFDAAIAPAPWTLPSHASIFTGRWAGELSTGYVTPLDSTFPTLAEYLSDRGYHTVGIVANLRYTGFETGLHRGFAEYVDYPVSLSQLASSMRLGRHILNHPRLRSLLRNDQHLVRVHADDINRRAVTRLPRDDERPVFAFLNYFDVHEPYLPPAPFDRLFGPGRARGKISPLHRWLYDASVGHAPMSEDQIQEEIDAYDGSMAYVDSRLRTLFASLRQRWSRPTLFIITADHGEEFGEHRVFDHGNSLYFPSVRVPLIIGGLDDLPPGLRVASPVSTRDIPVTVTSLLGDGDSQPFHGTSLTRFWSGGPEGVEVAFSEVEYASGHPDWFPISRGDMASLVLGSHRYILNGDGTEELYDLASDVWERRNLATNPADSVLLRRLRQQMTVHEESVSVDR